MGNTWVMPWKTPDLMSLRLEFVSLARQPGANVSELCRRFRISRKTGYKWLGRYEKEGSEGLCDQSRRPKCSPRLADAEVTKAVVELRALHPAWGPRKLKRRLEDLGKEGVPAHSTVGMILRRNGAIDAAQAQQHKAYRRFERAAPNHLWQMDFKGDFALGRGGRCYPLPIIDDHSRYLLGIFACGNQRERTVRGHLESVFEKYGLPEEVLCDNGGPWRGSGGEWTRLEVWLVRHGIKVLHGRPRHPQTQGKEERLNRTLKAEVLIRRDWRDLAQTQREFDAWRKVYNWERPHEALGLAVPATRYEASLRTYQPVLSSIEYGAEDEVRRVKSKGEIMWRNQSYFVGQAFAGEPIAIRATTKAQVFAVYYCHQRIGQIDLNRKAASKYHYISIRDATAQESRSVN